MTIFLPAVKAANQIVADTSAFDKKLAATDDTVQEIADTLDDHTHAYSEITGNPPTDWDLSTNTLKVSKGASVGVLSAPLAPVLAAGAIGTLGEVAHFVIVTALDTAGNESAQSPEANITLGTGENSISVSWTAIPSAVSYRVWVALTSGTQTGFFPSVTNSLDITELAGETTATLPQSGTSANFDGNILPKTDDSFDLGSPDFRWDDVYSTNGTIQTSDENLKREISPTKGNLKLINQLVPVSYKFVDGNRVHWGFGARQVERVVGDVALIVKNNDQYGLRYTELISPIVGAIQELTRKVDELSDKTDSKVYISDLNEILLDIESKEEGLVEEQGLTNAILFNKLEEISNKPVPVQIIKSEIVRTEPIKLTKVYAAIGAVGFIAILDLILRFI